MVTLENLEEKVKEYIAINYPDWIGEIKDICENGDVHMSDGFTIIKTHIRLI